jgi:hypothetical protein
MGAGRRFARRTRSFVVRLEPASQPHRLLRLTGILDTLSVTGPH